MRYPHCESTATTEYRARMALGYRRFRCGDCQRAFNERGGTPFNCACVDGEDPVSGQAVALFNPRAQVWADHFQWSEQRPFEIEGITAYGRATVVRLQMNPPDLVGIRHLLAELGLSWRAEEPRER
jgi:hypothetical protein